MMFLVLMYSFILQTPAVSEEIVMKPTPTGIRRQPSFPGSMPFPCKNMTSPGLGRSINRPTNVHRLRPGDIDVVGAMGDSLVAGNGALEEFAMGTLIEYRGVSWAAGTILINIICILIDNKTVFKIMLSSKKQ